MSLDRQHDSLLQLASKDIDTSGMNESSALKITNRLTDIYLV